MSTNETSQSELFTQEFTQNPYPVYEKLRQNDPIHRVLFPHGDFGWIISRYEDAVEVLKDNRFSKDVVKRYGPDQQNIFVHNMLFSDPPDHRRLRGLVQKAFTPRLIEGMRSHIQDIADDLLDNLNSQDKMNLIDEFAFPLPIIVISEILGVPLEDQDKFRLWSNSIIDATSAEHSEVFEKHAQEFIDYLNNWFAKVREQPGDDLISQLVVAEESGEQLTEKELLGVVALLIIAGHETTVNLIGNGVLALLEHPEQRDLLIKQPELIHNAVEEMLRYNGPVEFSTSRWASEDIEFHGHHIAEGELVIVALDSANRDEEKFKDADVFDITREKSPHLAFGKGIHLCLGAPLARLEGEIAINTLLRRFPDMQLQTDVNELEWRPGMIVRGVKEIPVQLK
ncbi:cytochrome P450 [Paenibacillus taichungensis]|uniref:Cytochrome P450 n=1 Tax=Paenibacillus taichungensis TaxID=484184 RepID=A0ABX2MS22_9BACL|nr:MULTISPECIES: cytochrome P450 [Paenibacillus]MEC0107402.1 cytochrome P450 [Paenibacillus taichungensis]MEC0195597.1 cytochrome P450 [Paenibacillus taichungensis]NUU56883.1 cytochrome P450 [Paenibacillus taichungensis]PIH60314.1 cytochrome P450 [Paenibacillus sp. LK1]SEN66480.1 Cytochrome P450 [Paenibacillus sp. OK076]